MGLLCSVCRSSSSTVLEDESLRLYRCGSCGHVFKDMPESHRERYNEDYFSETHKNWFGNPDYRLFELIYREIIRFKDKKKIKILDVGCGNGNFLKFLKGKGRGFELHGIDLFEVREPGINFIRGDISKFETPERFDVICNITVIEHLDRPYLFMERIKRFLSSDGIVFTVTDDDDSLIYAAARFLKKIRIDAAYNRLYEAHHLQCFSRKSLRILMEMNGFDVLMRRNHNHPVKAVDYPKAGPIMTYAYALATHLIFFLSNMLNRGILQIVVCKNNDRNRVAGGR